MEPLKILDTLAHNSLADNIGFALAVLALAVLALAIVLLVIPILTLVAK